MTRYAKAREIETEKEQARDRMGELKLQREKLYKEAGGKANIYKDEGLEYLRRDSGMSQEMEKLQRIIYPLLNDLGT